jgi:hypothetical protein
MHLRTSQLPRELTILHRVFAGILHMHEYKLLSTLEQCLGMLLAAHNARQLCSVATTMMLTYLYVLVTWALETFQVTVAGSRAKPYVALKGLSALTQNYF